MQLPATENDDTPLTPAELQAKVAQFEGYRNKLEADIERLEQRKATLAEDLDEYEKLVSGVAKFIQDGATSLEDQRVDVGCDVKCAARVPDISRIFVSVGLGFHVQVELAEVEGLVAPRRAHLRQQLGDVDKQLGDARATAAAFRGSLQILREGAAV
ncbi:hypothetical protein HYH02_004492 [Chlamydomonas schloesseri]|uniref:Uncharacterized protein n=1 Tax=Chlamydomonas schloesseri TaxID=2026947 RepID=A0A836B891_9CHLO|nr:hypothetical protein HYH02_004492 [Chlamydomonas schloesseri]|eukprot:KAG2450652.1 hypothetical protein HYH02_004492 [Chlamydomonas schloesseri]